MKKSMEGCKVKEGYTEKKVKDVYGREVEGQEWPRGSYQSIFNVKTDN